MILNIHPGDPVIAGVYIFDWFGHQSIEEYLVRYAKFMLRV